MLTTLLNRFGRFSTSPGALLFAFFTLVNWSSANAQCEVYSHDLDDFEYSFQSARSTSQGGDEASIQFRFGTSNAEVSDFIKYAITIELGTTLEEGATLETDFENAWTAEGSGYISSARINEERDALSLVLSRLNCAEVDGSGLAGVIIINNDGTDLGLDNLVDGGGGVVLIEDGWGKNDIEKSIVRIAAFPNPFSGTLNIESEENIIAFNVLSIQGKNIIHKNIFANKLSVDLSHVKLGMYFVEVLLESGKSKVFRMIKE